MNVSSVDDIFFACLMLSLKDSIKTISRSAHLCTSYVKSEWCSSFSRYHNKHIRLTFSISLYRKPTSTGFYTRWKFLLIKTILKKMQTWLKPWFFDVDGRQNRLSSVALVILAFKRTIHEYTFGWFMMFAPYCDRFQQVWLHLSTENTRWGVVPRSCKSVPLQNNKTKISSRYYIRNGGIW